MKINVLLTFVVLFSTIHLYGNQIDSIQGIIPFENPDYIGYRIELIELSSTAKNDFIKIDFTAINTGRQDLLFGKNITPPPSLVVNFDESLYSLGLLDYAGDIRDAIIKEGFHITAGKIDKSISVKIRVKTELKLQDADNSIATDLLENPRFTKSEVNETEIFTAKEAVIDDFEKGLVAPTSEDIGAGEKPAFDENACSDLVFESIKVIKKSKNKVTLEYTIINLGQGPARMVNSRKEENKNMALQAHMSSINKLTKGSLLFGGSFVENGLDKSDGKLYPGEKYTSTLKLDIQKMTKFTPYIILELDPYLSVYECDKKNNWRSVKVGKGKGIKE
ncbi:MAG: hypothetical protein ACI8X3_000436 [Saprospiraceae bacterium]|jgi:hypothetical protein